MKALKTILIILQAAILIYSCHTPTGEGLESSLLHEYEMSINQLEKLKANEYIHIDHDAIFQVTSSLITVVPSGDLTGIVDANNIMLALASNPPGGIVHLSSGNFYVSKNIVADGFHGTLEGEGEEATIIHGVRQSPASGDGFQPALSPYWSSAGYNGLLPVILQLDNSVNSVILQDFQIRIEDQQPTDLIGDPYGNPATHISTFIEILGGEHNTLIQNITIKGSASALAGNVNGMNTAYGVHVMLNSPILRGKGDLTVLNLTAENTGWGALLFMKYEDNSNILVDNLQATNVGEGITAGNIMNSEIDIRNSTIELSENGRFGMWIFFINEGLTIQDNTISNSLFYGLSFTLVENALITQNTIKDQFGCCPFNSAIAFRFGCEGNTISHNSFENLSGSTTGVRIWGDSQNNSIEQNTYTQSNLPGWTITNPAGPGAVILGPYSQGNSVFEMKFPPGTGAPLCEMIKDMTDDPATPDYDGNNTIHHWEPCTNLPYTPAFSADSDNIERAEIQHIIAEK